MKHTRQASLNAASDAGFTLLTARDLPVNIVRQKSSVPSLPLEMWYGTFLGKYMVPEEHLFQEHREIAGDKNLCLVLLAQK